MDVIYHDIFSVGSFGGINKLRRYASKRRKDVVDYLKSQDAYRLHKPIRRRFNSRRTYSKGIGDLYQLIQFVIIQRRIQIPVELYRCFFEKSLVITTKIKEWSRNDPGIRTDTR